MSGYFQSVDNLVKAALILAAAIVAAAAIAVWPYYDCRQSFQAPRCIEGISRN
jgi:hypothetical protein